jgi:hypothetical protein
MFIACASNTRDCGLMTGRRGPTNTPNTAEWTMVNHMGVVRYFGSVIVNYWAI